MHKDYYICESCGKEIKGEGSYRLEERKCDTLLRFNLENDYECNKQRNTGRVCTKVLYIELCIECRERFSTELEQVRTELIRTIYSKVNNCLDKWQKRKEEIIEKGTRSESIL
jgi:hypothetical protein